MKLRRILAAVAVLLVATSVQAKDKPVVAVAEFTNTTAAAWWRGGVGWDLSDMLSNELVSSRDFSVVERSRLQHVLNEQNLSASGRISNDSAVQVGNMVGAKYLIMGTVSAFEFNTKGTDGGVSYKGFSIGGKKEEAYMAIDLRVVNSETGVIEFVRTVEGRSSGGGLRLGVWKRGFGGNLANERKTPTGKAIRAALIESVNYLSCAMVEQGGCMAEYDAKEQRRRDSAKDAITLD